MKQYSDFILTTAPTIEGYRIIGQYGLVFGETVFKHGFMSRLGAGLSDAVDTISWGSREMSGSMGLIEDARQYAYDKMIAEAKNRGANAIIAIDSDNTFGGDVMYISLYGTAVKVVSEREYENQIAAEREAAAQRQAEKERQAREQKARVDELRRRRAAGEFAREEKLLSDIESIDSVAEIWKLWSASWLDAKYPDITKRIKVAKNSETMYGKMSGEADSIRKMIHESIFGE